MVIYTVTLVPYRIAFIEHDVIAWQVLDSIVDLIFMFDVLANCFSAVYIDNELITSLKKILSNYAKTWMLLDIISGIPFNMILAQTSWGSLTKLIKLPRLYRCVKIAKILQGSVLDKLYSIRFFRYFFDISLRSKRFLYFTCIFFIVCHLLTCSWYFISTLDDRNNWVLKYGYSDRSENELYISSAYWVVTTLATVGYGDITPANSLERGVCIIVMLLGVFFYSYTVGIITNLMTEIDLNRQRVDNKLLILQDIKSLYGISEYLERRIKENLKINQGPGKKEMNDFFKSLPRRLALQLNFLINRKLVETSSKFFEKKPIAFVSSVLECLKTIKLPAKEIIFSTGYLSNEIYFISKGQVCLYEMVYKTEISITHLGEGEYFGEAGVLLGEPRSCCAKTTRFTVLMILNKEDLFNALKPFEKLKEDMISKAEHKEISYTMNYERYSRQFLLTRDLANSMPDVNPDIKVNEEDEKFERQEKELFTIKSSLSNRTLKLIEDETLTIKQLKMELDRFESKIYDLLIKNNITGVI